MIVTYRPPNFSDWEAIAHLHARSWQIAYRGILSDSYLQNEVTKERRQVWQQRFQQPKPTQRIILATNEEGELIGFSCVYLKDDPQWGALLDNLHVAPEAQGLGVGKELLQKSRALVAASGEASGMYLFVFADNHAAIEFYERQQGEMVESLTIPFVGNPSAPTLRYWWEN